MIRSTLPEVVQDLGPLLLAQLAVQRDGLDAVHQQHLEPTLSVTQNR